MPAPEEEFHLQTSLNEESEDEECVAVNEDNGNNCHNQRCFSTQLNISDFVKIVNG